MRQLPAFVLLICFTLLSAPMLEAARAEEAEPPVPGPRNLEDEKPTPAANAPVVPFNPLNFDLLPVSDVQRIRFAREHPTLATRLTVVANRAKKLNAQYQRRKNKQDAGSKKLKQQLEQMKTSMGKTMAASADILAPFGVTPEVLKLVQAAPRDALFRIERYAHGLVLSLDLTPGQRALFERIVTEVNGAYYSLSAQRRRLNLVAKQSEVQKDQVSALNKTIDQQLYWNDKRFWMLTDYVLDDAQRLALKLRLPTKFQRIQNGIEHLYQLEGITPSQGSRAKSILTEFEAEASPDQALVKRNQAKVRDRSIDKEERQRLRKEMGEAGKRLQDLQLYISKAFKKLLTDRQYDIYRAIPPRLSHVDRRRDFRYVFDGMPFSAPQNAALAKLKQAYRAERRSMQKSMAQIRSKGADFGADSPQMEMMQMEMAGVAALGYAKQRVALGVVFAEILSRDQVSGWVLGFYGKVR